MIDFKGAISVLLVVYLVASVASRTKYPKVPIWAIMMFGAFVTVTSGLIPPDKIGEHVDLNVIFFLIGMFSIVSVAESSGLLNFVSAWFLARFKSRKAVLIASSLLFGLMAAVTVNDSVALIGPPIAYLISKSTGISIELMILLLMFSLTIGSVMTPLGNPQNMLIATSSGMNAPFIEFIKYLAVPTILNLVITPLVLMKLFKVENQRVRLVLIPQETIKNKRDAYLGAVGLVTTIAFIVGNDVMAILGKPHVEARGFIPMIIAAGLYIAVSDPRRVLKGVDWGSILFFIGMFITMDGIWEGGILGRVFYFIMPSKFGGVAGAFPIVVSSLALSQILSNVPFVKLFLIYMKSLGYACSNVVEWILLAMASTIAGNLTILGAASNVIVLEALESKYNSTVSFLDFLKYGFLVTLINILVYVVFIYAVALA
ncbi:MAG: SLC13 family permease [Thermoproteota archaeon]